MRHRYFRTQAPTIRLSANGAKGSMTEKDQIKRVVILTVGLPRSGKSTWARSTGYPIVCPDSISVALHGRRLRFVAYAEAFAWAIAETMVAALLGAGHEKVIVDACHATESRRKQWHDRFSAPNKYSRKVRSVRHAAGNMQTARRG
jgi:hypothetical protein